MPTVNPKPPFRVLFFSQMIVKQVLYYHSIHMQINKSC